jgi:hypothetical protein
MVHSYFLFPVITDEYPIPVFACSVCNRGVIIPPKELNNIQNESMLVGSTFVSVSEAIRLNKTPLQNKIIGFCLLALSIILWISGDRPEFPL